MYESKPYYYGTGRRKHSVARVRVYPGSGKITINNRDIDDYFGLDTLKLIARQPLSLIGATDKFDIVCTVAGGRNPSRPFQSSPSVQRRITSRIKEGRFLNKRPQNEGKKEVRLKGCTSRSSVQQALITALGQHTHTTSLLPQGGFVVTAAA